MRIVPFLIHAHPSPNPREDWNNNQQVFLLVSFEKWNLKGYISFSLASLKKKKKMSEGYNANPPSPFQKPAIFGGKELIKKMESTNNIAGFQSHAKKSKPFNR